MWGMANAPELLSVSEAQARILDEFETLSAETVPLSQALGRVLATDIHAPLDLPPFSNSSMDGYAIRAADVSGASEGAPAQLRVIADIAAGHAPALRVTAGTAARIMTGAPLPEGADSVTPVEMTDDVASFTGAQVPERVAVFQAVANGAHVRHAGEEVRNGEKVLLAGTVLRPAALGVLAALGVSRAPVVRRPRVAILGSGDELVDVDQPLGPGQVRNVNSYTLAALVSEYGGAVVNLGVARDSVAAVTERLRAAVAQKVDLILTSAGVSMGATDVVRLTPEGVKRAPAGGARILCTVLLICSINPARTGA